MAGARYRPLYVAIDFGTTVTVAAGLRPGSEPVLVQFGADAWMPSAVHLTGDGEVLTGRDAVEATAADPAGGQLTPKTMVGNGLEVETLRGRPLPLVTLVAHVIASAYQAALEQLGEPARVALTCPVAWAPSGPAAVKRPVLRAAAQLAGIGPESVVLDEAEAAAHHVGDGALPVEEDELFALYDLGGGTCDIAVLRRDQGRLNVVSLAEAEVGGEHFDWLLYEHVVGRIEPSMAGALRDVALRGDGDAEWRRCHAALATDVRRAKEALGESDSVTIHAPSPVNASFTVSAAELDALLAPDVGATADELRAAIDRAVELPHHGAGVSAVHLVGGSSLLPLVPRLVEAVTGLPARRADRPREAVALGAVQALEAWSGRGRPTRRGGERGEELHARRVIACAAMGDRPVLLHTDASGAHVLSRLDAGRGAVDRSAPAGAEDDALAAGDGVVAAAATASVRVWDAELRAVELPDGGRLSGPVRALHASSNGAWVVYEREDRSLWLRTIVVPDATDASGTPVRDVAIVQSAAGDSAREAGAPGLVTAARGDRLLVAVRTHGPGGNEQQVFLAAADGRLRKLGTRRAAPWLLDWLPTPLGAVEVEGAMNGGGGRVTQAVRLADAAHLELDPTAVALLMPCGGTAAVVVGTDGGWEAHRIDPTARGAATGRGVHLLCRDGAATLRPRRRPLATADGGWLIVSPASGGTAAVLLGPDGELTRTPVAEGARPVCASGGRLYLIAGDELRSVRVTATAPRTG